MVLLFEFLTSGVFSMLTKNVDVEMSPLINMSLNCTSVFLDVCPIDCNVCEERPVKIYWSPTPLDKRQA